SEHFPDRDIAFEIAAEGRHDRGAVNLNAVALVEGDDLALGREILLEIAVLIALEKRLRRGERDRALHIEASGRQRALETLGVEPKRRVANAGLALETRHHLVRIGPARDILRVDEGGDLNLLQARRRKRVDQRDLA